MKRIQLSDSEWMSIIDKNRDGLPICCANISALRDVIIDIAREGGEVNHFAENELSQKILWVQEGHELPSLIKNICDQLEIKIS